MRHEEVGRSGCVDPHVLGLGTRWRRVVSLTPRPLYTGAGSLSIDRVEKRTFFSQPGLRLGFLRSSVCRQSLYRLSCRCSCGRDNFAPFCYSCYNTSFSLVSCLVYDWQFRSAGVIQDLCVGLLGMRAEWVPCLVTGGGGGAHARKVTVSNSRQARGSIGSLFPW
jgi:hypothetical protein